MAQGIEKIPLRIPEKWDAAWYLRHIREVLALADTRNAFEGPGISITGTSDVPATISASADILNLLQQAYVLASPSSFLPNERILGASNGLTITDSGPNAPITVGIGANAIPFDRLAQGTAFSVIGRPQATDGTLVNITADLNDTLLRRTGDLVTFGQITLPMAPDALWTYAKIQDATALSVLGRASNTNGVLDEIVAGTDNQVLRRSGTAVGFGAINLASTDAVSGILAAPNGGTGFGTYAVGDILYASSTSALSKLPVGTDGYVLTLASGLPTWAVGGGGGSGANPTAVIGLTAVNGVATTFLRSDGAPALSQAIAPTWTSQHDFTGLLSHSVAASKVSIGQDSTGYAEVRWVSSTAPTDAKRWDLYADAVTGAFTMRAINDAPSIARNAFSFYRTGVALTTLEFGNSTDNPTMRFYGQLEPNAQSLSTGASVPTIGTNKPGSAVALTPSTWWGIVVNGTQYYIPLWI